MKFSAKAINPFKSFVSLRVNRASRQHSITHTSKFFTTSIPRMGEPRRFAPLKESSEGKSGGLPKLKGIVFDVDGTLWYVDIQSAFVKFNMKLFL